MIPIEQFHPLTVHFPIVFMLTLIAFDTTAIVRRVPISGRGAVANVSTGLAVCAGLAATVAFIFGQIAFDVAVAAGTPAAQLEIHEELGKVTAFALLSWAIVRGVFWWRNTPLTGPRALIIVVVEIGIAALVVTTAYFGGQLVYDFGVGVTSAIPTVNSP
jgi:uncharacterized membrane protein